ncbi:MAG TPA: hypothetical protein VK843_05435 [Planctomycetota bacterium]|nr:hypothetical protein [Planctomycetota bacterium]
MRERPKALLALVLCAICALAAGGLWQRLSHELDERRWSETESRLREKTLRLEKEIGAALESPDPPALQANVLGQGRLDGIRITLIRADGTVLADSEGNPAAMDNMSARPEVVDASIQDFGFCRRFSPTLGIDSLFVARAVRRDGKTLGWIRASVPTASIPTRQDTAQWGTVALIAAAALAALVLAGIGLRSLLRAPSA